MVRQREEGGGGEGENEAVVSGTRSFGRLPWERCFLTGR